MKALRGADVPLEERPEGDRPVCEGGEGAESLSRHERWPGAARRVRGAAGNRADIAPLALTHSPGVTASDMVEDEQSCAKARSSSLKQLAGVNLCADAACDAAGLSPTGQIQASCVDLTRWL